MSGIDFKSSVRLALSGNDRLQLDEGALDSLRPEHRYDFQPVLRVGQAHISHRELGGDGVAKLNFLWPDFDGLHGALRFAVLIAYELAQAASRGKADAVSGGVAA